MPDQINGYSRTEYLSVFITLLYAIAAAEFLIGWGKMMRYRNKVIIHKEHLVWTIILFITLIGNWYAMWPRLAHVGQGFLYFMVVFLPIIFFYFLAIWLFPDLDKEHDLDNYFEKNARWIILILTIYFVLQITITLTLDQMPFFSLAVLFRAPLIIFGVIAFTTRSTLWRRILLGISIVVFIVMIIDLS